VMSKAKARDFLSISKMIVHYFAPPRNKISQGSMERPQGP
jgi:hypothetical protein